MKEFHRRDFANRTGLAQAWTVKSADRLFTFPGTIKKHCLGPKPRPPYGLVGPNHSISSNLGPFSHKRNISHPTKRKAQNAKPKMDTLTTKIENAQVG